ncbi:MAG TPA: sigma-70 family RNA polymerase sigma factor, partial [Planctomycetaceae bacterium]|nr:sigma-70 family RNA polymerase sigma factor [Planctomycetaceae bacterium]
EQIVKAHSALVWTTAFRLLGHREDASDCVQDAFLEALAVARREPVRSWKALLVRIATCSALDRLRRRARDAQRETKSLNCANLASPGSRPDQAAERSELADRLGRALAELPEQQAEVFCLRVFNKLRYREIARQTGIHPSTVSVLLYRARLRPQALLATEASNPEREVIR